jgi:transcriptional regulator with XRE-family HTH domain
MADVQDVEGNAGIPAEEAASGDGPGTVEWGGRVDFAQRLNRLFEETRRLDGKRWTLQYVADECTARGQAVTKQYILHLKSGVRTEPRLNLVEALADVFRVPVAYFTADYAGRMTSDLLPLLVAMSDPRVRMLLTRDDLPKVLEALASPELGDLVARHELAAILGALADFRVQSVIETALADPMTVRVVERNR